MLVLLPPSETKVAGGESGTHLDVGALSFPVQNPLREALLGQISELVKDEATALRALKLGPKGAPEVQRNRELASSPVMPALQRYTGVLYDALGLSTLDGSQRAWVDDHVAVFSALFGLLRASDRIPAYRLSWDSKLSGGSLVAQWDGLREALWSTVDSFVLDLRSEGYRKLSPVPDGAGVFVSVVQPGPRGSRKALGHANKSTKGHLVRALAQSAPHFSRIDDVVSWGESHGYVFDATSVSEGSIDLVISGS